MLEGAAGCLKQGVRRPWRLYKRSDPTRSRRTLCSSFWRHGAGDLELPSWYYTILQHSLFDPPTACSARYSPGGAKQTQLTPFLDFLYPENALVAFTKLSIRHFKRSTRLDPHFDNSLSRKYLSLSRNTSVTATPPRIVLKDLEQSGAVTPSVCRSENQSLQEILLGSQRDRYREAWRGYMTIPIADRSPEITQQLICYLATSSRTLDAKRTGQLLESLPFSFRLPEIYAKFTALLLRVQKLGKAVLIHTEAVNANKASEIDSAELLSELIAQENWQLALKILAPIMGQLDEIELSSESLHAGHQCLWVALERCSNLVPKIISLLTLLRCYFHPTSFREDNTLQQLIFAMVNMSLNKSGDLASSGNDMISIIENLQATGLGRKWIYERALRTLLSTADDHASQKHLSALAVYRLYREEPFFSPTSKLLTNILRRLMRNMAPDVLTMLRMDWQAHQPHLTPDFVTYLMTAYSRSGNLKMVHEIFDEFVEQSRFPVQLPMLQQLMQVHVLRSEAAEAKAMFNDIKGKFGLEPNITCWNILINAYAKADNHGEAIRCLTQLLDAGLKPDMYTFGTVMASAAAIGKAAFIKELLNVVDDQGIKKTSIMFDSLVKALINEEELLEAEEVVMKALTIPLVGSKSYMWAQLILAHGLRLDPGNAMRVYALMQRNGIKADAMTYAALLRVLTISKRTDMASKLLTRAMPAAGVKPQPIHYIIVMNGYMMDFRLSKANEILQMLKSQGHQLTPNVLSSTLRLAAAEDKRELMKRGLKYSGLRLQRTDALFDELLRDMDPSILATNEPLLGGRGLDRRDQSAASYFVLAMNLYHSQGSAAFATDLVRRYRRVRDDLSHSQSGRVPLAMLRALMKAYYSGRLHRQVVQCWVEAKRTVQEATKTADGLTPETTTVKQRHALARHLDVLMRSLRTVPRGGARIRHLVKTYVAEGYVLDGMNWNVFVELIVSIDPIIGFETCEEKLMQFPLASAVLSKQNKAARSPVEDRSLDRLRQSVLMAAQANVFSKTMNRLRRSLRELQTSAVFFPERRRVLERIHNTAPNTIAAIEQMQTIPETHVSGRLPGRSRSRSRSNVHNPEDINM